MTQQFAAAAIRAKVEQAVAKRRQEVEMNVVLAPHGTGRRVVKLSEIVVPDLWHLATRLRKVGEHADVDAVLETWGLVNDLLHALRGCDRPECKPA